MKVQQFLAQHGISENPFGQEDAQCDHVFRQHCLDGTHHPAWDKIFGSPENPSTAVVFGEKGSGKTALRMQLVEQFRRHAEQHPDSRAFVVEYDDFNPFLDCFLMRLPHRHRKPERALSHWRLWDHMDAILSLAVGRLSRSLLDPLAGRDAGVPEITDAQLARLSRTQKRDLLLLDALYHHGYDQPPRQRWAALRRRLKYSNWKADWDLALGTVGTLIVVALVLGLADSWKTLFSWWVFTLIAAAWGPWLWRMARLQWLAFRVARQIRVFDHLPNTLRAVLARFERQEIAGQPVPAWNRSDDRYELLAKLQSVLKTLGFGSLVVLVDRVDEPHLVNGSPERMRDLLWPMLDNKFLKHVGLGFKMLLPAEVTYYLNREEKAFYERSRLDKQNLVPALDWTGESLYDVANDRIRACVGKDGKAPAIGDLFDPSVTKAELVQTFGRLRVPRHLFKFLHRLLVEHCLRHTEDAPNWKISRETLQSTLALFLRDLDAFDRGLGTG